MRFGHNENRIRATFSWGGGATPPPPGPKKRNLGHLLQGKNRFRAEILGGQVPQRGPKVSRYTHPVTKGLLATMSPSETLSRL